MTSYVMAQPPLLPAVKTTPRSMPTMGRIYAMAAAKKYVHDLPLSKKGLEQKLRFDKYQDTVVTYVISKIKVNWNKQAKRAAKQYKALKMFGRVGITRALRADGFTSKQIKYGLKAAKVLW